MSGSSLCHYSLQVHDSQILSKKTPIRIQRQLLTFHSESEISICLLIQKLGLCGGISSVHLGKQSVVMGSSAALSTLNDFKDKIRPEKEQVLVFGSHDKWSRRKFPEEKSPHFRDIIDLTRT